MHQPTWSAIPCCQGIGTKLGLYWDNLKENGNHDNRDQMDTFSCTQCKLCIVVVVVMLAVLDLMVVRVAVWGLAIMFTVVRTSGAMRTY